MNFKVVIFILLFLPLITFAQLFSYDFGTSYISSLTGTGEWCVASPNYNTSLGCTSYGWAGDYSDYITTKSISIPSGSSAILSFNYK